MVYTFIISDTVIRVNGLPLANLGQFEHEKNIDDKKLQFN